MSKNSLMERRFEKLTQRRKSDRKARRYAREHTLRRLIDPENQPATRTDHTGRTWVLTEYGWVCAENKNK